MLLQRIEDEQVRQALERGCDRHAIMDVLDISRRTTFHKQKRAYAHDFPLDVLRRSGNGGQHPAGETASETTTDANKDSDGAEEQQRLDSVVNGAGNSGQADRVEPRESAESSHDDANDETTPDEGREVIREQLETAITALQRISAEL